MRALSSESSSLAVGETWGKRYWVRASFRCEKRKKDDMKTLVLMLNIPVLSVASAYARLTFTNIDSHSGRE